jgi:putative ABC transport system permease protein
MNIPNLIRIAIRALQRNKLRAFLTMLGIIIGVAAVIAMVAIGQGSKKSIQDQLSSMGSNMITIRANSNATVGGGARLESAALQSLTLDDIKAIEKQANYISAISPAVQSRGQVINGALNWPTQMQGVAPDYLEIRGWKIKDGVAFSDEDVNGAAKVCLVGQTIVDNLFTPGDEPVGKIIRYNKIPVKIIGVLAEKGENAFGSDQDDVILAPYTTVQKRIMAITYIQNIYASAINENSTEPATAEISQILRASHKLTESDEDDFSVRTQAELSIHSALPANYLQYCLQPSPAFR